MLRGTDRCLEWQTESIALCTPPSESRALGASCLAINGARGTGAHEMIRLIKRVAREVSVTVYERTVDADGGTCGALQNISKASCGQPGRADETRVVELTRPASGPSRAKEAPTIAGPPRSEKARDKAGGARTR